MPNKAKQEREQLRARVGIDLGQRALHTLRLAGGARRVVHRRARHPVLGLGGRLRVDELGERPEAGDRPVRRAGSRARCRPLRPPRSRASAIALVADEHLGVGVLEDVRDLGRRQPVVDRHVVEAGLQRREIDVHRVRPVRAAPPRPCRPSPSRGCAARARPGWRGPARHPRVCSVPSGSTIAT